MTPTAIITGITGQDGAYLSELLLDKGYKVIGFTRSPELENYNGLEYLNLKDKVELIEVNLLNQEDLTELISQIKPNEIYHLASQSSVGVSYKIPVETVNFNIMSATNLLETIRTSSPKTKFFQAASTEIFGNNPELPVNENTQMNPMNPYAVSKAAVQQLLKIYRSAYDVFAASAIFCNHESYLRHPNFLIKKVISQAIKIQMNEQENIQLGNLEVKRDMGFAPDYVKAMWLILQQEAPDDFVICSGESVYLKEVVEHIFNSLKIDKNKIIISQELFRPNELKDVYGDNTKAKEILGWNYNKSFYNIIDILIEEEYKNTKNERKNCIHRSSIS